MKRIISLVALCAVVMMAGCAVTKDGVKLPGTGGQVDKASLDEFNTRNGLNKPSTSVANGTSTPNVVQKIINETSKEVTKSGVKRSIFTDDVNTSWHVHLIAIGNTMAVTDFTEKELVDGYDLYEKKVKTQNKPMTMSRDFWMANMAGYATVEYWSVPLVMHKGQRALISKKMRSQLTFPSAFTASMFGATADLVAAEVFDDYGFWITRVLCSKEQPDFDECSKKYAKGRFQVIDGREIDNSLKVVENGPQIGLNTYQVITSGVPQDQAAKMGK